MHACKNTHTCNHTTAKLVVVTLPRVAPGSGPVMVETLKGGVSVSWIKFTFVEASIKKSPPAKSKVGKQSYSDFPMQPYSMTSASHHLLLFPHFCDVLQTTPH